MHACDKWYWVISRNLKNWLAQQTVNLSPHDLLDRLADLVPPPRKHRRRSDGNVAQASHHELPGNGIDSL